MSKKPLLLSVLLGFGLAACGSEGPLPRPAPVNPADNPTPPAEEPAAPNGDTPPSKKLGLSDALLMMEGPWVTRDGVHDCRTAVDHLGQPYFYRYVLTVHSPEVSFDYTRFHNVLCTNAAAATQIVGTFVPSQNDPLTELDSDGVYRNLSGTVEITSVRGTESRVKAGDRLNFSLDISADLSHAGVRVPGLVNDLFGR